MKRSFLGRVISNENDTKTPGLIKNDGTHLTTIGNAIFLLSFREALRLFFYYPTRSYMTRILQSIVPLKGRQILNSNLQRISGVNGLEAWQSLLIFDILFFDFSLLWYSVLEYH